MNRLYFDQNNKMVFDDRENDEVLLGVSNVIIDFLLIAGGGGGGNDGTYNFGSGGGGAGGFIYRTGLTISAGTYPILVGAGGPALSLGENSTFSGFTADGGGFGRWANIPGTNGGCGGGAGAAISYATAGGTGSQGYNGGGSIFSTLYGGGGGGIGSIGGDGYGGGNPGPGGNGRIFNGITGTTFGHGGDADQVAKSGSPNTGNGGTSEYGFIVAGSGGSGIVMIKYLTSSGSCTGGIITTDGSYTVHTFITSDDFIIN